jgi:hypothetical protein
MTKAYRKQFDAELYVECDWTDDDVTHDGVTYRRKWIEWTIGKTVPLYVAWPELMDGSIKGKFVAWYKEQKGRAQ